MFYLVCEEVSIEGGILQDGVILMEEVETLEDLKSVLTNNNKILEQTEKRVKEWMRKLKDFMLESKQIRRENDSSGPQQELEYWKKRGAQFSQLLDKLEVDIETTTKLVLSKLDSELSRYQALNFRTTK